MEKDILGTTTNGRKIYSLQFKKKVVDAYNALPTKNGSRVGTYKLCEKYGITQSMVYRWDKAFSQAVTDKPLKSATSVYQGGATVKPARPREDIVAERLDKMSRLIIRTKAKMQKLIDSL